MSTKGLSPQEREAARERARAALAARAKIEGQHGGIGARQSADVGAAAAFLRAETEDDDGYDPYSDRPAAPQGPEEDPWR